MDKTKTHERHDHVLDAMFVHLLNASMDVHESLANCESRYQST